MKLSRRTILQGVGSLPFAVASLRTAAIAQTAPAAAPSTEVPPILFVHGNGDYDALWMTTLWRMESNGVARERMMAINFTDPLARSDDKLEQAGRSSTEDQRRELAAAIAELKRRTGATRVALVGSSRGGYAIRNVIKNGGAGDVSHAVLCGTPNHGVFATDDQPNNEFNGRGTFLRSLNEGESEVTPGVAFLTLRSDGLDKYAQPDGRFIGKPGTPTNVNAEGPELRGATNLVLGALDHREVTFHPRAFREIYKFIAGREPARIAIVPETNVRLSGLVTGTPGGVSTNRPVAGATVDIFRVDPETGERMGSAVHSTKTGADGRWGPAQVEPSWSLEFVLAAPDAPITHIYRSPFPRSSDVVHLRPARPVGPADKDADAVVIMSRPRGYFGLPRDVVLFDGREPADVKPGVPTDATATLRLPASEVGRNIVAQFGEERIVARTWPAAENRIAIAELTY
ncbi:hydrolase [Bradyrhizobium vignae]|uniref:Hydrolase n=1 Tax=Bradyrhizobium vignae TaxID=1549949 RepID=A0ABS3ZTS2_9BRAD|nr:hydrolase [Bradyrhizobium vignae]MBP0111436.1 hydrolase [Bradyrhizobium vignae]RXH00804.1 hydrolase [Bradyrhizobium vignae]